MVARQLMKSLSVRLCIALLICSIASTACEAAEASGFYRVEQRNGVWWFVAPDGRPFFSNGVNVIATGATRENYRAENPEYAAFRHYPTTGAWVEATLARLRAWNFNTIGAWSSAELRQKSGPHGAAAMPYTVVLDLGRRSHAPWSDLFSREVALQFDQEARRKIGHLKDDPNLLGYFTDNELGWWDDTLLSFFLEQPRSNATRRVLMRLMREHYRNDFARLRRDFDTGGARSFAALDAHAPLTLRPGGRGQELVDKFAYLLAERYYQLTHDAIRRYDPNHLILGDRFIGWYVPAVARAAGKYVDVISTNYAADWPDGNNSHFFLDTLHKLTRKPIIVTEYYMCAMENRSGNQNSSANFPVVQTQRERAESFRTNLTALAAVPYVVGAHWFQYYDEPTRGRATDGENYNMGLVDINDQPYEELTASAALLNPDTIHTRAAKEIETTRAFVNVPAVMDKPEDGLRGWNKRAAFIAGSPNASASLPFADLYASWDEENLYLAVHAVDFAEPKLYARNVIPDSERMTWTINLGAGGQPLQIRFGANRKATVNGASVAVKEWQNSTRFTALVKLPAKLLGNQRLRAGESLRLRATLASHGRAETMEWKRELRLDENAHTVSK